MGSKETPLFCLRDICEVLEVVNVSDVKNAIDTEFGDGSGLTCPIMDSLGREQKATFITEPQLYFVLMRSDKPKAKPFRQWVVNEVLPSIRKQGFYMDKDIESSLINELRESNLSNDLLKKENQNLKDEIITLQKRLLTIYDNTKSNRVVPSHYGSKLNEGEKEKILNLRKKGVSITKIQRIMQRSECAIRSILRGAI